MILLDEVGAFAAPRTADGVDVRFGIYLPKIDPHDGYELLVRVIHEADRFDPAVKTMDFPLQAVANTPYNLWQSEVTIPLKSGTHFGQPGRYLYRYQLRQSVPGTNSPQVIAKWFTDPFARNTDVGLLSAFHTLESLPAFAWDDGDLKVPDLDRLVVYEMQVEEFNGTFDGVIEYLPYLKSLGLTCLDLMPITSQNRDFD